MKLHFALRVRYGITKFKPDTTVTCQIPQYVVLNQCHYDICIVDAVGKRAAISLKAKRCNGMWDVVATFFFYGLPLAFRRLPPIHASSIWRSTSTSITSSPSTALAVSRARGRLWAALWFAARGPAALRPLRMDCQPAEVRNGMKWYGGGIWTYNGGTKYCKYFRIPSFISHGGWWNIGHTSVCAPWVIFRCGEASRCPLFLRLRWCETALDHRKSGAIGQVVAGVISDGELRHVKVTSWNMTAEGIASHVKLYIWKILYFSNLKEDLDLADQLSLTLETSLKTIYILLYIISRHIWVTNNQQNYCSTIQSCFALALLARAGLTATRPWQDLSQPWGLGCEICVAARAQNVGSAMALCSAFADFSFGAAVAVMAVICGHGFMFWWMTWMLDC